jgi:DNA repair protein RadC
MWLPKFITHRSRPSPSRTAAFAPGDTAARGFAEQSAAAPLQLPLDLAFDTPADTLHPGWSSPAPPEQPPFPTTGPAGHRARMRQRVLAHGADSLADYEILEVLLYGAFRTGDTKPLAKALINRFGSFAGVLAAPLQELMTCRGIGPHSIVLIKIVQAAALALARAQIAEQPVLNNRERLMDYLNAVLAREKIEQFRVLFLDTRNRLIADEAQARGTVNHTPVYPREVVRRALELHATALILVHNHPSGDPTPSMDDIDMTDEIRIAAGALGIALHDHIIVGNGRSTSFREEGLLRR